MQVVHLWRYPVKSLGGEHLDAVSLGPLGLHGDRRWGIRDLATGTVLTARREPKLLLASACLSSSGEAQITLPGGRAARDGEELSAWLGRPVALEPASESPVYEAPLDAEHESDWVSWQGPDWAWHDDGLCRVSILSTATIGGWDVRRFRPNVVLDGDGEDDLVGRRVRLGTATVEVTKQITRCVMVTRPQPGLDRDIEVLRTVNKERGGKVAVGGVVVRPGTVGLGDQLQVL